MQTPLVAALQDGGAPALVPLLAEDVAFHSPVRSYRGSETVLPLLAHVGALLPGLEVDRAVIDGSETVTFLRTRVGELALEAVLDERTGPDGRVVELTLLLRPLKALLAAVEAMGAALAAAEH